jgi:hypothetical protein
MNKSRGLLLLLLLLLWLCSALVGPGSLFQFLDPIHSRQDSLDGRSDRRKSSTYTQKNRINAHNTDVHVLNGIRTHVPSVRASEDSSCFRPRDRCARQSVP